MTSNTTVLTYKTNPDMALIEFFANKEKVTEWEYDGEPDDSFEEFKMIYMAGFNKASGAAQEKLNALNDEITRREQEDIYEGICHHADREHKKRSPERMALCMANVGLTIDSYGEKPMEALNHFTQGSVSEFVAKDILIKRGFLPEGSNKKPDLAIGDVVIYASGDKRLNSGEISDGDFKVHFFSVIANLDPFTLVSGKADAVWIDTVKPEEFIAIGKAPDFMLQKCVDYLKTQDI